MFEFRKNINFFIVLTTAIIAALVAVFFLADRSSQPVPMDQDAMARDSESGKGADALPDDSGEEAVADKTLEDNIAIPAEDRVWSEDQQAALDDSNRKLIEISTRLQQVGRKLQAAQDSAIHSDPRSERLLETIKSEKATLEDTLESLPEVLELQEKISSLRTDLASLSTRLDAADQTEDTSLSEARERAELEKKRRQLRRDVLANMAMVEKAKRDARAGNQDCKEALAQISSVREELLGLVSADEDVQRLLNERSELIAERDAVMKMRIDMLKQFRSDARRDEGASVFHEGSAGND